MEHDKNTDNDDGGDDHDDNDDGGDDHYDNKNRITGHHKFGMNKQKIW